MAVDDISRFRKALPEVFEDRPLPPGLEDYEVVPVDNPEDPSDDPLEDRDASGSADDASTVWPEDDQGRRNNRDGAGDGRPAEPEHPGGLVERRREFPVPPPDALAFYLPFHFYEPTWWGVYLLQEGVEELGSYITWHSPGQVRPATGRRLARMFLYGHEQFHHISECFTTRLESTHREPLYRTRVWERYRSTWWKDACTEEALANAFGFQKALKYGRTLPDAEWQAAKSALQRFIAESPPGYRMGGRYLKLKAFDSKKREMAEEYQNAALPSIPPRPPNVWLASSHAFSGIARITSRVNYLVRRDSPLARRVAVGALPIRYREVSRALTRLGCVFESSGRGSHEKWRSASGKMLTVPRHHGDLKTGTLKSIFKAAGHPMGVSEIRRIINDTTALEGDM